MAKLIIEFPNEELREWFLGYWSDGGGEYQAMEAREIYSDKNDIDFDYSKAFPAWGYNPEVDGDPKIIVKEITDGEQ